MFGLAAHDPYFKSVSLRSRNASKNVVVEVSHALFPRYIEADPGFRAYDSPTCHFPSHLHLSRPCLKIGVLR